MTTATADETKAAADQAATDKAAADKAAADKAAADQAAADAATAGKTPEQIAAEKAAADTETARKAADEAKAPEKYELKLPEGGRLSKGDLADIEAIARANNWSNADAQAAIDEHDAALRKQSDRWLAETAADPELGGEKLAATQQRTKAAIDWAYPQGHPHREGFLEFLNRGGAGNNIHVVRFLEHVGKAITEDTPPTGRSLTRKADLSLAERLYPPKETTT